MRRIPSRDDLCGGVYIIVSIFREGLDQSGHGNRTQVLSHFRSMFGTDGIANTPDNILVWELILIQHSYVL